MESGLSMADRHVLITGADGFIGSHLTEALVRQGHEVRAFVLYNSFNSWGWLEHCSPDVYGQLAVQMDHCRTAPRSGNQGFALDTGDGTATQSDFGAGEACI